MMNYNFGDSNFLLQNQLAPNLENQDLENIALIQSKKIQKQHLTIENLDSSSNSKDSTKSNTKESSREINNKTKGFNETICNIIFKENLDNKSFLKKIFQAVQTAKDNDNNSKNKYIKQIVDNLKIGYKPGFHQVLMNILKESKRRKNVEGCWYAKKAISRLYKKLVNGLYKDELKEIQIAIDTVFKISPKTDNQKQYTFKTMKFLKNQIQKREDVKNQIFNTIGDLIIHQERHKFYRLMHDKIYSAIKDQGISNINCNFTHYELKRMYLFLTKDSQQKCRNYPIDVS